MMDLSLNMQNKFDPDASKATPRQLLCEGRTLHTRLYALPDVRDSSGCVDWL